ncbi:MAG TPA: molybdopterin molybdenumtransferase MoeA, partial [Terriglobales bacterium]|nr:molybdopterin molybdenumtransferase MoeA [Terriglobales bacterium]
MAATLGTISFEQARHLVEEHSLSLHASGSEEVELLASGRVLAEVISADRPFPPFRRASRDGYAVRASDLQKIPVRLRVVGEIKAGEESEIAMESGDAVSIMTGAATPADADAIVMVEYTKREGEQVEISRGVERGANIVATGSEAALGEHLLLPGTRIDHAAISVAASVGKSWLNVFREPRVAILATGDELVAVNSMPGKN